MWLSARSMSCRQSWHQLATRLDGFCFSRANQLAIMSLTIMAGHPSSNKLISKVASLDWHGRNDLGPSGFVLHWGVALNLTAGVQLAGKWGVRLAEVRWKGNTLWNVIWCFTALSQLMWVKTLLFLAPPSTVSSYVLLLVAAYHSRSKHTNSAVILYPNLAKKQLPIGMVGQDPKPGQENSAVSA